MRTLLTVPMAGFAAMAVGQAFPGTKADPVGSSSSAAVGAGPGIGSLFNVLLALGIVYILLKVAMPKLLGRMNRRLATGTSSEIRIEESATFAGGSLYVVNARGRALLLSVSGGGVQCLADLTETAPAAPEPPTFGDFVEQEIKSAAKSRVSPPVAGSETPAADGEWSMALERLERLERLAN